MVTIRLASGAGARARVVYGDALLALDWNATVVKHWPLHKTAHNNTRQCLHNLPIFREAWAQHAVEQAPCGPDADTERRV